MQFYLLFDNTRPNLLEVSPPRAAAVLARLVVIGLLIGILALALIPWQQSVPGQGRVIAYAPLERQQMIEAPIEGRVQEWHVAEDDRVKAGDPIADISDNDPEILARLERERLAIEARRMAAQSTIEVNQAKIAALELSREAQTSSADLRAGIGRDRLDAAKQALAAATSAEATARLNLERTQLLFEEGLTSKRQLELAELEAQLAAAELDTAKANPKAAKREIGALDSDAEAVDTTASATIEDARAALAQAQSDLASADSDLAQLETRLARQQRMKIVAPRSGTVLRLIARQGGEIVTAGDPIAAFVPDMGSSAVELWVAGKDGPLISPGRKVRLQFEGWPAVQFVGWPSAAVGTFGGVVEFVDATAEDDGRFRIVVVPRLRRRAVARREVVAARRARERLGLARACATGLRAVAADQRLPACARRRWSSHDHHRLDPVGRGLVIAAVLLALLLAPPEGPESPPARPAVESPPMVEPQQAAEPRDGSKALMLSDVLDSVASHDPRLAAAEHAIADAEGQLKSARGGYDTSLQFTQFFEPLSRMSISRVHVEQATPVWGLTAWAGYQIGVSSNPRVTPVGPDGRLLSTTGGELFAGVTLPLLRDSWTDSRRTEIAQSKLERERRGEMRDATQLQLELDAATAYWNWVAAGLEVEIEERILELAVARQDRFLRQIELGAIDRLVGVDNKRVILDRESRVVLAERAFQAAALELSLYLRDSGGQPLVAGVEHLPSTLPTLPALESINLQADIDTALNQRPDRQAQLHSRDLSNAELRWARNQRMPRVDLSAWAAQKLGHNVVLDAGESISPSTELLTSLHLEIPIPMRWARGRVQSAEASVDIAGEQLRLLDNQIAVEVSDAHLAVIAAHRRALLAGEQVALTEELAQAELRRFELGDGDLLQVNLRELTIADAAGAEIRAVADFFIAKANLEVAKGGGVVPVEP